jgi:TolB-like protein/class 3 adenylate cyclase/cytochrome c-type biogenesis protein CcmH/NrfG
MSAELPPDLQLEIAHLLLIDVVGYSKLLVNEQIESLQQLNRAVRSTGCFRAAEARDKLIRLPTGDGMALLFFESPEQPMRCALETAEALRSQPQIQVRMGIHSGPVNQVPDVNDRINIAGAGINVAQRVLDCGDAGHILLSKHVAEDLGQYRHWQPYLKDLGECEVKHGLRLHVVNLCKNSLGNPQVPEKFKRRQRWKEPSPIHPISSPRWPRWAPMAALLLSGCALAIGFTIFFRHRATSGGPQKFGNLAGAIPEKSIAVLPFENLSDDKQNAYFADGVQDEILTNLAKVADLKVISRTSMMQYKNNAERNLREIGTTLGVAHILEGTVQRSGGRVRVSAQLIDARTDVHLWAEHYDREIADVFAIENELAEQIVAQLKSRLSPVEKAAIEQKPTADLAAYDLYTRAKILIDRAVFNEPREASLREAVQLLEQASSRDRSFALAYYELAHAHDQLYWQQYDHTPRRLALADAAIQTLRRLQPDSGEAHLALAKHLYWGYLDYDQARQELAAAQRVLPNDSECLLLLGYIDRRQGRWDESVKEMGHAQTLDPRNIIILKQLALSFRLLRRYSDVIAALDRALELDPNDIAARSYRARVDLEQRGDTKSFHANAVAFLKTDPNHPQKLGNDLVDLALFERDPVMAARALSAFSNDYTHGIESVSFPPAWCEGRFALLRGDTAAAKAAFGRARKELEKTIQEQPDNAQALIALGLVNGALGQKRDAIDGGRRAVELLPVTKDAIDGALFMEYLAAIYAMSGNTDSAIEQLAATAKLPGHLNYGELRLDPIWDPLRRDPRFDKIVASLAGQ